MAIASANRCSASIILLNVARLPEQRQSREVRIDGPDIGLRLRGRPDCACGASTMRNASVTARAMSSWIAMTSRQLRS